MSEATGPRHVGVNGRRMAYAEAGSGRPVLLLHGNFGSKRWFSAMLAHPPAGLRYLAPDLPNFGDSDPLGEPIRIEAYAEALLGFASALDLGRPALLGHSLGGAVAMAAVAAEPSAFADLALVDASTPSGLVTPEAHYPLLEAFRTQRPLLAQALAGTQPSRQAEDFEALVDDAMRMWPEAFSGNARALHDLDLAPGLAAFTGRVLVLRGGMDLLIDAAAAEATAAAFVGATEVRQETWPEVGHSPPVEAPERLSALLAVWLGGKDTPP